MQTTSIDITSRCPCNCFGCWVGKNKKDMSLEDFKTIIAKLPKGIESFVISGGEPALNRDLVDMCRFVSKTLIPPTIFTSGVVKMKLEKLKPFVDNITFTIKYPFADGDEFWKGVKNSLVKAEQQMKRCNDLGIKVRINWAVDMGNFIYIDEMSQLAKRYNARIGMLRFMPYSEGVRSLALTDEEWEMVCYEALKHKNISIMHPSRLSYDVCLGGVGRLHINVEGNVSPCIYWSFDSVGNLLEDDYGDIEKGLERWRKALGEMKMCPVQQVLI